MGEPCRWRRARPVARTPPRPVPRRKARRRRPQRRAPRPCDRRRAARDLPHSCQSPGLLVHQALRRCRLTAHVSTKLNRAHLVTGRQALILPCLGRTELVVAQDRGAQRHLPDEEHAAQRQHGEETTKVHRRNRTDDLRITRRIRAVHGRPGGHTCLLAASRSARVRGSPGPLLANPLARSLASWLSWPERAPAYSSIPGRLPWFPQFIVSFL